MDGTLGERITLDYGAKLIASQPWAFQAFIHKPNCLQIEEFVNIYYEKIQAHFRVLLLDAPENANIFQENIR